MKEWLSHICSVLSNLGNVIIFNGHPDESICARCYREDRVWAVKILNKVVFWEGDHCYKAHISDVEHALDLLERAPKEEVAR